MSASVALSGRTSAAEVLEMVYEHRLLSTRQVHLLHRPGGSLRSVQRVLKSLADDGLVAASRRGVTGEAVWWATATGARSAEAGAGPKRPYRLSAELARGPLRQHTLDVNEVGIAFVAAARTQGDYEASTVNWHHEVKYRVVERRPGGKQRQGESITPDSVLRFTAVWPNDKIDNLAFFVEVDRGNRNYPLVVSQLGAYYKLFKGGSGWKAEFVDFPCVLMVLSGKPEPVLVNRRHVLLQMCEADVEMKRAIAAGWKVPLAIVLLSDLVERGPLAPVFWEPGGTGPVSMEVLVGIDGQT